MMSARPLGDARIDAFISYNRDDREDVAFIAEQLRLRGGVQYFMDNVPVLGSDWLNTIQMNIHLSETFLLFLRRVPTAWQMSELQVALQLQVQTGKPYIIPVLLPAAEPNVFRGNPNLSFIWRNQAAEFSRSTQELDTIDNLWRAIVGNSSVYVSSRALPRKDRLPSGFKADLGRLADLLISESVYRSRDICIRELIQNARDACSRRVGQREPGRRTPQIIVDVDDQNRYFDVIDYGDGMSRDVLANAFSVLGKTFNDDFHAEDLARQELSHPVIGRFGIGFISTFMVAQRITISTKSVEDSAHHFRINDVKLPFEYTETSECERHPEEVGTTVRIHLKRDHSSGPKRLNVQDVVKKLCRHVPDLVIHETSRNKEIDAGWNFSPEAVLSVAVQGDKYETRLSWSSDNFDSIKLSNGGFWVTDLDGEILGEFPKNLVSGEINVVPGIVDLTLSRDGVVPNDKIQRLRDAIGLAMSKLFEESADRLANPENLGIPPHKLAQLGETIRRISIIMLDQCKGNKLGLIPIDRRLNFAALYKDALLAQLSFAGSVNNSPPCSVTSLRHALSVGNVAIVYAESFYWEKLFTDKRVRYKYISLKTERFVVQRRAAQSHIDERLALSQLTEALGLKLFTELQAYWKYYGYFTLRGWLYRLFKYVPD